MFADWDCIFRKLYPVGDGQDKSGYDGFEGRSFRRLFQDPSSNDMTAQPTA